jgi:hypothetical protein
MMTLELALVGVAWLIAVPAPAMAQRITDWAVNTLPGPEWYF